MSIGRELLVDLTASYPAKLLSSKENPHPFEQPLVLLVISFSVNRTRRLFLQPKLLEPCFPAFAILLRAEESRGVRVREM